MTEELTLEKKISEIIQDRSLPKYIKSEYPAFVSFLKAYYEYLEQSKNTHDVAIHLRDYRGIDTTIDDFIEYFRKEFMVNIPEEIIADKRLLAKHIKQLYLNKGNEASYRFLFRILYNEELEFYYPKTDILRASDGKWYEQKSIKIILSDPDLIFQLNSKLIKGLTSGATAVIESAIRYNDRGAMVVELTLSEIRGTFQFGEQISFSYINEDGETVIATETIEQIYTGVQINEGGSGYSINDQIIIRNFANQEIAKGIVLRVTKGPITGLDIDVPGINYNGNIKEVTKFYALPGNYTFLGQYLPTAVADGSDDSNHIDFTQYTWDETIPLQEIPGTGDTISINDSSTSFGSGAFGVVEVVGNDGEILEVTLLDGGNDYQAPTAEVESVLGTGANIDVIGGGGSIASIGLDKFPIVLPDDEDSNGDYTVYPDFTLQGDGNAEGEMLAGTLAEYPGRYLNEDGQLSSSKKLQDNFYYQDYSYVLKIGIAINQWRDLIKKIVHPAGLAVFGEINIIENIDMSIDLYAKLNREIITEGGTHTAVITDSIVKLYVDDSNGQKVPVLDSNGNHLIDF